MYKKILIIALLSKDYISGNLIDCIDIYYNIRKYLPTDLIILVDTSLLSTFYYKLKTTFTKEVYSEVLSFVKTTTYNIDFDKYFKIICRYNYLRFNQNILNYKNIFVIVGWNMIRNIVDYDRNILKYHIISTPFIYQFIPKFKYKDIYISPIKFSEYRLNNIILSKNSKNKIFNDYNNYDIIKHNKEFNIHSYERLNYYRHIKDKYDITSITQYIEIKGKSIFEFLYFGKQVHYLPINKYFNDGLTDYFKLFNIDDDIEQDININKKELYNNLIKFNKRDKLLDIITS